MRRVMRHSFNVMAAVSLLICLGAIGMGMRSRTTGDYVAIAWESAWFEATSERGRLDVLWVGGLRGGSYPAERRIFLHSHPDGWRGASGVMFDPNNPWPVDQIKLHWLGFGPAKLLWAPTAHGPVHTSTGLVVPYWLIAVTFGLIPFVRVASGWRRRQRNREGRGGFTVVVP